MKLVNSKSPPRKVTENCHPSRIPTRETSDRWPFSEPSWLCRSRFRFRPPVRRGKDCVGALLKIYIYIYILFFNGMFLSIEKGVGIFWEVSWFLFTTCFFEDKNKDYRQLPVRQRLWQVLMTMIIILINLNSGFCLRSCPFPWLILNKSFLQIEKLSHSSQNSLRKRTKHVPIFKGIWFFIFKPFLKGW